jgi:GH43 family beta-xylosidase
VRHEGRWYFIATDDTNGDNQSSAHLSIRVAPTLDSLAGAEEHIIVHAGADTGLSGCFWAPELHVVAGVLTIFFSPSVGPADWQHVRSYVMQLRIGGDPVDATDWGLPREVKQQDGMPLRLAAEHPGISLDMTYVESGGRSYVAWSQRSLDDVAPEPDIWIAALDPAVPDRLLGPPIQLVRPMYGWERNCFPVAEGPYFVHHGRDLWMTFSASEVGPTYAAGLLHAPLGADLADPGVWTRTMPPALSSAPGIGQWGPGHNTFVTDDDGQTLLVYHAMSSLDDRERHTGVRPVHWAADGRPVLDMTPDEEVAPSCRRVRLRLAERSTSG